MMNKLEKCVKHVTRIEYVITVIVFLVMLLLMFVQVLFRYIIKLPLSWSEELLRFLFIAATYLGCAIATKERGHIEINLIEVFIKKRFTDIKKQIYAGKVLNIVRDSLTTVLLLFILYESAIYMNDMIKMDIVSETMMIPMWIVTLFMVAGITLSLFHIISLIILNTQNKGSSGFDFEGGTK